MAVARSPSPTSPADVSDVGARLSRLERDVEVLTERVARLDQLAASGALVDPAVLAAHPGALRAGGSDRSARIITHTGQMLIALGVGYLLRALTEAELVAHATGVWIGLVYAVGWIGVSMSGVRRGDRLGAWFAAALAPMLAFPLIVEAALRFDLWSANAALLVLAAVTAASLVVATLNGQQSIAWVTTLGAGGTAAVLMVGMRAYVPAEVFYIALGLGGLWLGYLKEWTLLRWPTALAADVVAVALVLRALNPDAHESPYAVMAVLLLLLLSYPASILVRTIVLNRSIVFFEVVQSLALLLLLRGALALAPLIGSARPILGVSVFGLGVATFGTAVFFGDRRRTAALNAHFYAALGVVVLMVGSAILLDGVWLAATWAMLAWMVAVVALRRGQETLMAHATALGLAAAVPCGLITYASSALVGSDISSLGAPPIAAVAICVMIAALVWTVVRPADQASAAVRQGAAVVASIVFLLAAAGIAAGVTIGYTGGVSTVRTVVLSATAVAAAAAGRWTPIAGTGWAAYPFLAFIAVKLLAEDLRVDRPIALFIALAVYGAALMITARLSRRAAASSIERTPGS
jgi:hypothetical protein